MRAPDEHTAKAPANLGGVATALEKLRNLITSKVIALCLGGAARMSQQTFGGVGTALRPNHHYFFTGIMGSNIWLSRSGEWCIRIVPGTVVVACPSWPPVFVFGKL